MLYPVGAQFFSERIVGTDTVTALTADSENPVTVLMVKTTQEDATEQVRVHCGTVRLSRSWEGDALTFPWAVCTDDVEIIHTGPETAIFGITYLPFNIHEATGQVVPTTSPFTLSKSYTFGELTIALLLIPLLIVVLYQTILQAFRKPVVWHK